MLQWKTEDEILWVILEILHFGVVSSKTYANRKIFNLEIVGKFKRNFFKGYFKESFHKASKYQSFDKENSRQINFTIIRFEFMKINNKTNLVLMPNWTFFPFKKVKINHLSSNDQPLCCEVENLCFSQFTSSLKNHDDCAERRIIFWNIIKYCDDVNARAKEKEEKPCAIVMFAVSSRAGKKKILMIGRKKSYKNWASAFPCTFSSRSFSRETRVRKCKFRVNFLCHLLNLKWFHTYAINYTIN